MSVLRIALLMLLAIGLWSVIALSNPLHWTQESLRSWLLRQAPYGSSFEEVQAVVATHKWASQNGWGGESLRPVKGIHWFQADLGYYRGFPFPLPCHARVMWGFDHEKLVDIRVEKWCEGL